MYGFFCKLGPASPDRGKLVEPQCRHGTTNNELRRNKGFCQMNECIVQAVKAKPTVSEEPNRKIARSKYALPPFEPSSVEYAFLVDKYGGRGTAETYHVFHVLMQFLRYLRAHGVPANGFQLSRAYTVLVVTAGLVFVNISAPFAPTCCKKVPLLRASSRVSRHIVRRTTHVTARSARA